MLIAHRRRSRAGCEAASGRRAGDPIDAPATAASGAAWPSSPAITLSHPTPRRPARPNPTGFQEPGQLAVLGAHPALARVVLEIIRAYIGHATPGGMGTGVGNGRGIRRLGGDSNAEAGQGQRERASNQKLLHQACLSLPHRSAMPPSLLSCLAIIIDRVGGRNTWRDRRPLSSVLGMPRVAHQGASPRGCAPGRPRTRRGAGHMTHPRRRPCGPAAMARSRWRRHHAPRR